MVEKTGEAAISRKPSEIEEEYVPVKSYISQKKRCGFILILGVLAVVAVSLGLYFKNSPAAIDEPESSDTRFKECENYEVDNSTTGYSYFYEGVGCNSCIAQFDEVFLSDCNHTCTDWTVDVDTTEIDPVLATCVDPNAIIEEPDYDGACPIGYYKSIAKTGCKAATIEEHLLLGSECFFCTSPATTHEACFEVCEQNESCSGVIANPILPDKCYAITYAIEHLCHNFEEDSSYCKKIPSKIQCFDELKSYDAAAAACDDLGGYLALDAQNAIKFERLKHFCPLGAGVGCYVEDDADSCYYVESSDTSLNPSASCDFERGYCCQFDTDAPTAFPTAAPTPEIYFVIPEETSFEEAHELCLNEGAELVSIHSQAEQDFVWDICLEALIANTNPCGCWNGFNILGKPITLDPEDFVWTDGSANDFEFFETYPEVQPNNNGDRDEECVHMRPFTRGGWNDLPCAGFCDADDTKPFPLCKRYTDAPTTTPTFSPTKDPTTYPSPAPTGYPSQSPTKYPSTHPTYSPTEYPTKSPTKYPTNYPTEKPTTYPSVHPTESPTKYPTRSPTNYPTVDPTVDPTPAPSLYPSVSPTEYPTPSPSLYPSVDPTVSPTKYPTFYPSVDPTRSPTKYPTYSPTTSAPTGDPTPSPTKYPTKYPSEYPSEAPSLYPTVDPTVYPTESPSKYPTKYPSEYPTPSPSKYPTDSPTKYPTYFPTEYPSVHPTESPTAYPTKSPTKYPTKYPTDFPTGYPTVHPTKYPTDYPTKSPTKYPTKYPTPYPTDYPSKSPTPAPTNKPDGECKYKNGEGVWRVKNYYHKQIKCNYVFDCTKKVNYCYDDNQYPYCHNSNDYCYGPDVYVPVGQIATFFAPADKIYWWCQHSCDYYDHDTRRILTGTDDCWHETPSSDDECKCDDTVYFLDNFDSYQSGYQYNGYPLWNKWDRSSDSLVYVRSDADFPYDQNDVCASPGGKCLDLVGKIQTEKISYEHIYESDREFLMDYHKHSNIYCTVSFKTAGSRRCGKNSFNSENSAIQNGCHQYYDEEYINVDNSLAVKFHRPNSNVLNEKTFYDIKWHQEYREYSVTADVYDTDDYTYVSFQSEGQYIDKNLGRTTNKQPVGNYIDDVKVTCCCVELFDKYIYKNVFFDQGQTGGGEDCPQSRSDPDVIANKPPNDNYFSAAYDNHEIEPQVVSLGLAGTAVYRFDSGFYKKLYIYEETLLKCKYSNWNGLYDCEILDHDEDAKVEVSVDGLTFETVANSLNDEYQWYIFDDSNGYDNSRRLQDDEQETPIDDGPESNVTAVPESPVDSEDDDGEYFFKNAQYQTFSRTSSTYTQYKYVKRIRYVKIHLPENDACYKYVKITDLSSAGSYADDGFDLHAIKTSHVCCNDIDNDASYVVEVDDNSDVVGSGVEFATPLLVVGSIAAVIAGMLLVTQIRINRQKNRFRRKSIMELDAKVVDEILEENAPRKRQNAELGVPSPEDDI